MNLFFGKQKASTAKESITKLRETLSMLEKRQAHLEIKAENELKAAKENATKNKRAALMALKKKKGYEVHVEKINSQRMTIETQMMALENANVNLETIKALRAGAEAMKGIHGSMDINKVDATMDDIQEQMELANEISDAIARPVGYGEEVDEDELLQELEDLEQEELDAKMLETSNTFPETPHQTPASKNRTYVEEDDEEEELRALQASMAI